ncbi:MAG: PTS sugar transporter subunit IIA [Rubrivivax sp.]|nr:PTS sugar transporter subunit IIA [Rubrivivax sp.]
MASILIVAHAPLASSLQALARHAFADCERDVAAVDLPASADLDQAQALIGAALAGLPGPEVLVLVDVFGATPCNAALNVADGSRSQVVAGVNAPMLWRALCYAQLPLNELVSRAVDGGRQGIMEVAAPRRQNPPNRPPTDDPDANPDRQ